MKLFARKNSAGGPSRSRKSPKMWKICSNCEKWVGERVLERDLFPKYDSNLGNCSLNACQKNPIYFCVSWKKRVEEQPQ